MDKRILTQEEIDDLLLVMANSGAEIEPFPVDETSLGNFELLQVKKRRQRKRLPIIILHNKRN